MASADNADPRTVARQLRKPFGEAARAVGESMDVVNEPLFELVREVMQPVDHQRVLEIGFGTGTYMDRLFAGTEGLEIHGVDHSPEMTAHATRANRHLVDAGRFKPVTGASDDLPFEDRYFDKVYCNMVIYFWDEPEAHLREVQRVLKPGGGFYTGMRTKQSMLQFPFVSHGFALFDPEEWLDVLGRNGFEPRETVRQPDPVINLEDGEIQMESVCIGALKR